MLHPQIAECMVLNRYRLYNQRVPVPRKDKSMTEDLKILLKSLFSSQLLAVLGTQSPNGPYGNLVAFAATDDLKHLLFATSRPTRKYENLLKTPEVALVIDNRSNQENDFRNAVAVTATGSVREATGPEKDHFQTLYLEKHPSLRGFVEAPSCALLNVEVDTYFIVRQFQQVVELRMQR